MRDLEETINRTECDSVIIGTPIDLGRLLKINKPSTRVTYELKERGDITIESVLKEKGIL
jgi:predicted GTPase